MCLCGVWLWFVCECGSLSPSMSLSSESAETSLRMCAVRSAANEVVSAFCVEREKLLLSEERRVTCVCGLRDGEKDEREESSLLRESAL